MKIYAALFAVLATALSLNAVAQSDLTPADLSHSVAITLGRTVLQPGDSIVIDAIHGTADTITAGNIYRVDGHYTLASQPEAQLAINVTSNKGGDTHAPGKDKDMIVAHGSGSFTLYFRMIDSGDAHLSFYPSGQGGSSFASVYFNPVDKWAMAGAPVHPGADFVTR